jgi:hypothetical protein
VRTLKVVFVLFLLFLKGGKEKVAVLNSVDLGLEVVRLEQLEILLSELLEVSLQLADLSPKPIIFPPRLSKFPRPIPAHPKFLMIKGLPAVCSPPRIQILPDLLQQPGCMVF